MGCSSLRKKLGIMNKQELVFEGVYRTVVILEILEEFET